MRVEKLRMDTIINFKPKEALNINPKQDVKEKVKGPFTICNSQTLNIFKKTSLTMNFKVIDHKNVSCLINWLKF